MDAKYSPFPDRNLGYPTLFFPPDVLRPRVLERNQELVFSTHISAELNRVSVSRSHIVYTLNRIHHLTQGEDKILLQWKYLARQVN